MEFFHQRLQFLSSLSKWQLIGLCLLALVLGFFGVRQFQSWTRERRVARLRKQMEETTQFTRMYIGRISFEVPADFTAGASARVGGSKISEEPWTLPESASRQEFDTTYASAWQKVVEKHSYTWYSPDKKMDPDPEYKALSEETLADGTRVLLYQDDVTGASSVGVLALYILKDRAVLVERDDFIKGFNRDGDNKEKRDETMHIARAHTVSLLAKLRRTEDVVAQQRDLTDVLFVHRVAVLGVPYIGGESAQLVADGASFPTVESLAVNCTERDRDAKRLSSTVKDVTTRTLAMAMGVRYRVLRSHSRLLDGLDGDELVAEMSDQNSEGIAMGWKSLGSDNAGAVTIEVSIAPAGLEAQLGTWDHLLDSVRWYRK